mmetsp:Transcript_35741/g.76306  ORF Transcript_35741/g.76306 Transcript_35741/m.76306 type:complete len:206 (-) Transcript_35741:376-993(-)
MHPFMSNVGPFLLSRDMRAILRRPLLSNPLLIEVILRLVILLLFLFILQLILFKVLLRFEIFDALTEIALSLLCLESVLAGVRVGQAMSDALLPRFLFHCALLSKLGACVMGQRLESSTVVRIRIASPHLACLKLVHLWEVLFYVLGGVGALQPRLINLIAVSLVDLVHDFHSARHPSDGHLPRPTAKPALLSERNEEVRRTRVF